MEKTKIGAQVRKQDKRPYKIQVKITAGIPKSRPFGAAFVDIRVYSSTFCGCPQERRPSGQYPKTAQLGP